MARSGGDVPPAAAGAVRSGARRVPDEGPGGLGAAGGRHLIAVAVRSGARRVPDEGPGGLRAAGGRHLIAVSSGGRQEAQPSQKAASSTSISALSVRSTTTRSAARRGSTWVQKNRAAASLPA